MAFVLSVPAKQTLSTRSSMTSDSESADGASAAIETQKAEIETTMQRQEMPRDYLPLGTERRRTRCVWGKGAPRIGSNKRRSGLRLWPGPKNLTRHCCARNLDKKMPGP